MAHKVSRAGRQALVHATLAAATIVCAAFLPVLAATPAPTESITFTKHIAPLIFERCAGCHRSNGGAPFSLLTYADVRRRARDIASVTRRRVMPPWKSEPGYGEFIGQRPLSDPELDLIQRWVNAGAPRGRERDLPALPQETEAWQLGRPDLVVASSDAYSLPAEGSDTFRVFVVAIPTTGVRYVKGLELRPDDPRVVHHANVLIDRTSTSRERNTEDPSLGERGLLSGTAGYPDGYLLGWTPGQSDPLLPKGLSWRLDPGTDLVVQLHLKPSGKPTPIRFKVAFYFSEEPPQRTPALLRLGRQSLDMAAGDPAYAVTDTYVLPVDVNVLALKPHAHYRATQLRGFATLPDKTTRWLLFIKEWDFRWQHTTAWCPRSPFPRARP